MAGNGTMALEIIEDLQEVDTVVVPWGGGGLPCGVAVAMRALRPQCKVYAAEVVTAAPLAGSRRAGGLAGFLFSILGHRRFSLSRCQAVLGDAQDDPWAEQSFG
jgi:cysteine synthase